MLSNTLLTCPSDWDSLGKLRVIPDMRTVLETIVLLKITLKDGTAAD